MEAAEHFKQSLTGHTTRSMEVRGSENHVNYDGFDMKFQRERILASGLGHSCGILAKNMAGCFLHLS